MLRRTRLLIKPKVGPATAPTSTAKPPPVPTSTSAGQGVPPAKEQATTTRGSAAQPSVVQPSAEASESNVQAGPVTPTPSGLIEFNGHNTTSEVTAPVSIAPEEKTSTRLKRAGPRIPPPKPSKPSVQNAPLAPKNAHASVPPPPESVVDVIQTVEASPKADYNRVKDRAEDDQIVLIEAIPDEVSVDKASLSIDETSPSKFADPPKKQKAPKANRSVRDQNDSDPLASLPPRLERKAARRANEFREMLIASRRKFAKVKEPIDTSKLTMLDLIYYNPPGEPMARHRGRPAAGKDKEQRRRNGSIAGDVQESLEPELEDESTRGSGQARSQSPGGDGPTTPLEPPVEAEVEEEEVIGPRVVVGADGSIQIDEASLVIRRPNPEEQKHNLKVIVEEPGKTKYDSFKTKKTKKCTWTTRETSKFYRALSICGTDFTLMTQFFPTRSRQDLKNKFKREERSNPTLIDKAIHHPTQFEYTEGELEDISRDDEEEPIAKKPREPKCAKVKDGSSSNKNNDVGKGTKTKGAKRGKKKRKEEPPDKDNCNGDLADPSDGEEVGFRNGVIEDALARTRRKRAKVDYAEMHEGGPDTLNDDEDRDLEMVEVGSATESNLGLIELQEEQDPNEELAKGNVSEQSFDPMGVQQREQGAEGSLEEVNSAETPVSGLGVPLIGDARSQGLTSVNSKCSLGNIGTELIQEDDSGGKIFAGDDSRHLRSALVVLKGCENPNRELPVTGGLCCSSGSAVMDGESLAEACQTEKLYGGNLEASSESGDLVIADTAKIPDGVCSKTNERQVSQELIEEDTAADNYVMLDEASGATPSTQQPASHIVPSTPAVLRTSVPSSQPVLASQLVPAMLTTNRSTESACASSGAPASPQVDRLPNPKILPPGLEPGQLVLFAPHGNEKALHFFVVNPPSTSSSEQSAITGPRSDVVLGGGLQQRTVNTSALAGSAQVAHGDSERPGTNVTSTNITSQRSAELVSEGESGSVVQREVLPTRFSPAGTPHVAVDARAAPLARKSAPLPKVTFKSRIKKEDDLQGRAQQTTSATNSEPVVAAVDRTEASMGYEPNGVVLPKRIAEPAEPEPRCSRGDGTVQDTFNTAQVSVTAAPGTRKPLPRVVFKSRAKRGSALPTPSANSESLGSESNTPVIASIQSNVASEPNDVCLATSDGSLASRSNFSEDAPSTEISNSNVITKTNVVRDRKPAILSRRRAPLVVRKQLHMTTKVSEAEKDAEPAQPLAGATAAAEISSAANKVSKDHTTEANLVDDLPPRNQCNPLMSFQQEPQEAELGRNISKSKPNLQKSSQIEPAIKDDLRQPKAITATTAAKKITASDFSGSGFTAQDYPQSKSESSGRNNPSSVDQDGGTLFANATTGDDITDNAVAVGATPKARRLSRRIMAPAAARTTTGVPATPPAASVPGVCSAAEDALAEMPDTKPTIAVSRRKGRIAADSTVNTRSRSSSTSFASTPHAADDSATPTTPARLEQQPLERTPPDLMTTLSPAAARIEADIMNLFRDDFEKAGKCVPESPTRADHPVTRSSCPIRSQSGGGGSGGAAPAKVVYNSPSRTSTSDESNRTSVDNEKDSGANDDSPKGQPMKQDKPLQRPDLSTGSSAKASASTVSRPHVPVKAVVATPTRAKVVLPQRKAPTQVVRPIGAPVTKSTVLTPVTIRRPPPSTHPKSTHK